MKESDTTRTKKRIIKRSKKKKNEVVTRVVAAAAVTELCHVVIRVHQLTIARRLSRVEND